MKIVHLCFRKIKNTHSYSDLFFGFMNSYKIVIKKSYCLQMLVMSCISIIFFISYEFYVYSMFSVVLPNTLLLISLKNLFQIKFWLQFISVCENQYPALTKQTD